MPTDEPPHLKVGGERAPLPRMQPSPRPEPLWGGVVMPPQCPRGRAVVLGAPSMGACRVSPGGGGLPLSLRSPHPAAGGWWVGRPVAHMQAPRGGPPHESLEYWRAPRPRGALAGQPRAQWCVSWCARQADALRVTVVPPAATVSHSPVCQCACWTGGVPMPLADPVCVCLPFLARCVCSPLPHWHLPWHGLCQTGEMRPAFWGGNSVRGLQQSRQVLGRGGQCSQTHTHQTSCPSLSEPLGHHRPTL